MSSSTNVTHYINAYGKVWAKSGSVYSITSNSAVYNNSYITTGDADPDKFWTLTEFDWIWRSGYDVWGLGVYKISNSKAPNNYFYLDGRDYEWAARPRTQDWNPDLHYFVYDHEDYHRYEMKDKATFSITNGDVIRPYEILGHTYDTDGLQNFWSNALVIVKGINDKALLIWGKHPTFSATNYKLYRALSDFPTSSPSLLTYSLIYTGSSTRYDIHDPDVDLDETENKYVYYYVKAYNSNNSTYSSATNIVDAHGYYSPMKRAAEESSQLNNEYALYQNYPNPFNPTTSITYSIKENTFVTLEVFDILGNVVEVLESSYKIKGNYQVEFNGSGISSGMYFIRLQTADYMGTIKIILHK